MCKLVSFFTKFLGGDFLTILSTKAQDWGLVHFQSICFTQKSGVIRYFSHELSETDQLNQPIPFPDLWSSSITGINRKHHEKEPPQNRLPFTNHPTWYPPGKPTWQWKVTIFNKWFMFHCHVRGV